MLLAFSRLSMLQRFAFAQKRPLNLALGRCSHLTYSSTSCNGLRHFASAQHAPRNISPPNSLIQPSDASNLQSTDTLASWTTLATPFPEFAPIITALACDDPFDNILRFVKNSPPIRSLFHDRNKMRDVAVNLAQSSAPHRCIDILQLSHHIGHTLKHGAYEAVAFHLATNLHWRLVLVVASIGIQHVHPTVRLLNWRARALFELQEYNLLQHVLHEFDSAKLSPSDRTYSVLLAGCLHNHDLEGARRCIRRMQEAGFPVKGRTLALIGSFHRHFGVDLKVQQASLDGLSDLSPDFAVAVLNSIIQSALDMQDVPTTLKLLTLFKAHSVREITCTLTCHERLPGLSPQHLWLPKLPGDGLQPNTQTFTIFMNYLIRSSNYQRAIDLGQAALTRGFPATVDIATSLVHAFFLQNRGNVAIEMIARLSSQPIPTEFYLLMARTAPVVDQHTIPNISEVPLTTRICNALLRGILRRQGLRHVPRIFAIMHANNLRPNARTLEILIAYMSSSEGVRPRTILKVMQQLSASSFEVSVRHMHHLIRYILREEKRASFGSGWKGYEKRHRRTNLNRKPPKRQLTNSDMADPLAGIAFGSHTGYNIAAKSILQSLVDRKVKSDPALFSMRIRRDALLHGEFESAQTVFRTMAVRGMQPSHHHFSALMEGYAMMGDLDSAQDVMKLAQDAGVAPNVVMYTILIHGHGRKNDAHSAMRVFQEMVQQKIYPDVASIDAVVGAFFATGARKLAREYLIMLWPYIEPFPEALQKASLVTLISYFRSLDVSRSRTKKSTKARASIYHSVRRLLSAYRRYFGPIVNNAE